MKMGEGEGMSFSTGSLKRCFVPKESKAVKVGWKEVERGGKKE